MELEPVGDFGAREEQRVQEVVVEEDGRAGMESGETRMPSEEELRISTVSAVRPLKEMVRSRKMREREEARGEAGRKSELQIVQLLSQVDQELLKATDLKSFTKVRFSPSYYERAS